MIKRITLLAVVSIAAAVAALFMAKGYYTAGVIAVIALVAADVAIFRIMNKPYKDVDLLLEAVKNSDTSLRFTEPGSRVAQSLNQIARILHRERCKAAESERTYSLILESVSAGVMVVDARGYVVKINGGALRMLGLEVLTHIDRLAVIDHKLPSMLRDSRAGNRFHIKVNSNSMSVRRDVVILVSEAVISDEKLKIFVFDDIAVELDSREVESWSRLTRVLIHEIINSLTPVTSISHTLLSSPEIDSLPPNIRTGLDTIGAMSESLTEFVNNFRTLSSPPTVNAQLVELKPLLGNMIMAALSTAPENVAIRLVHCDEALIIYADSSLTARVITNLLSNAVAAVEGADNAAITISARCNPDDSVTIDISNNGPIIEPSVAENIFVPFFTTRCGGQGIGLALSRQIMQAQGGNVSLLPYGPTGLTTFRITFP